MPWGTCDLYQCCYAALYLEYFGDGCGGCDGSSLREGESEWEADVGRKRKALLLEGHEMNWCDHGKSFMS